MCLSLTALQSKRDTSSQSPVPHRSTGLTEVMGTVTVLNLAGDVVLSQQLGTTNRWFFRFGCSLTLLILVFLGYTIHSKAFGSFCSCFSFLETWFCINPILLGSCVLTFGSKKWCAEHGLLTLVNVDS